MLAYQLQVILFKSLIAFGEGRWWDLLSEDTRLIFSLVLFFVNLLVLAIVLYLAGLVIVGKKRALLRDAFIISLLGTVLSTVFFMFIPSLLALALSVIVWLLLIKRLYETSWLKAIAVGIMAIIIFLAVTVLLALIFGILYVIFERFLFFAILIL
jgi:hypothetical protein